MLRDIYDPIDTECEQCIQYAQTVLDSDIFLAGLGKFSSKTVISQSTNVITDFERADYLMDSREMMSDPIQREGGDQFFSDVLQGAFNYPSLDKYSLEEQNKRTEKRGDSYRLLGEYIKQKVFEAYEKNDVRDLLAQKFSNPTAEGIERHLDNHYPGVIYTCTANWINAAYFGGKDDFPLCAELMDSLAIGGVPTGWIGPQPKNGGKGKDCLQIIHFGQKK